MKKNLLSLLSMLLFTYIASAQVLFGVQAGGNVSTLKGDAIQSLNNVFDITNGIVDQKSKFGFTGRAYASLPISQSFGVETGLSYQQKGYKISGDFNSTFLKLLNTKADLINTSHYIGLDALAKVNISEGLSIKAGPQISYLAKNNLNIRSSILGFNLLNQDFDLTSNTNIWDMGLTGGISYKVSNGITINGYYTHGLSPIDKNANIKAYNRSGGITVGFEF
ncbi:MAG: porin family protein [Sphingobacteriales bacterium]